MRQLLLAVLVAATLHSCKEKADKTGGENETTESMSMEMANSAETGDWMVLFDGTSFDLPSAFEH